MKKLILLGVLLLTVAGCASQPRQGDGPSLTLTEARAHPEQVKGRAVRWGGEIASTLNRPDKTRIEIVSRPLDGSGRPRLIDRTEGRFVAYVDGFLDPVVYAKGREITVEGEVAGVEPGRIGDYPYRFMVVRAVSQRLWPRRKPVVLRPIPDPYPFWRHDPWRYPYSPWWW